MPAVSERGCLVIAAPATRVVVRRRHRLLAAGTVRLFALAGVQVLHREDVHVAVAYGQGRIFSEDRYTARFTDSLKPCLRRFGRRQGTGRRSITGSLLRRASKRCPEKSACHRRRCENLNYTVRLTDPASDPDQALRERHHTAHARCHPQTHACTRDLRRFTDFRSRRPRPG